MIIVKSEVDTHECYIPVNLQWGLLKYKKKRLFIKHFVDLWLQNLTYAKTKLG